MQFCVRERAARCAALGAVAALSLFVAGASTAAPVVVTYAVGPTSGSTLNLGGPNISVAAGSYNVTYSGGAATVGGTISDGSWSLTGIGLQLTAPLAGSTVFGLGGPITGSLAGGTDVAAFSTFVGPFNITGSMSIAAGGGFANLDVVNGMVIGVAPFNLDLNGVEVSRSVVPEPGTGWLVATGLLGLVGYRRKSRRA